MTSHADTRSIPFADRLADLGSAFRRAVHRRATRWATVEDLRQLSDRELRDIGLSRDQIGEIARDVPGPGR